MNQNPSAPGSLQFQENEFKHYLGLVLRRKWIIMTTVLATVTLTAIASFKARHVYRSTAQLLIEKEYSSATPYRESVAVDLSSMDYYQTQYRIMKSRSLARQVIEDLSLDTDPEFGGGEEDPVDVLLSRVIVDPIKGSRLVNLSVESHDPERATEIANALAETYVEQNLANKLFASREILKKLPQQLSASDLRSSEIESLPSVVGNPLIQELKAELVKYEAEYANLTERYKPRHPTMVALQSKIDHLRREIVRETQNTVESLRTELSGEFKSNNVRIIDPAEVPDYPVRPQRKRNIVLAFILSGIGGFFIALFVEYMDNTLKSGDDIEKYLGLPFLGIVPVVKEKTAEHFIVANVKTPCAEALNVIRTNLVFSAQEEKLKTILITSCSPGEGKTFVSMNIAASFAQAAKKTLLIDSDLRRNTLTKAMKLKESNGLSNYLIGESELDEVIQETEVKNLYHISAGTHSPDPAELLGSDRMKQLVGQARQRFDRVIIDSAPVLPVSDTLNIANLMDGIVQVVSCGKLSRNVVVVGKQKLQGVGAKIVGVVLNHVNVKAHTGQYGYGYYAYEYGEYY